MHAKKIMWCLVALLFLIPSAALAANPPGVTDTEIVIGISTPLSGPAALWGMTGIGAKAYADYINEQGGIHGRKLKIIVKDDGYNPTRAMANFQEMKGQVFAVCALLGSAICNATKDFFPDNKIPVVGAYGDVRIYQNLPKDKIHYYFVAYPDYEDEAEYMTKYAAEKLGLKKLAIFYQNDNYGKMAKAGVEAEVARLGGGVKIVDAVPYEATDRALSTQALKLKQSGTEGVIMYPTPTHGALIVKEMAKIGFRPKQFVTFTLADPIMYRLVGPPWEGTYVCFPGSTGVPGSDAAADRVVGILKKYEPKVEGKEFLSLFGAMSMIHLVEGLKNAGRDLTVEGLIKGMEQIKDWLPEGAGSSVTYGPDRHHGNNASRMGLAKDGKHTPITDFTVFKPRF